MKILKGIEIFILTVILLACLATLCLEGVCLLLGGSFGWYYLPVSFLGLYVFGKPYLRTQEAK